jgi:hypothetical protein
LWHFNEASGNTTEDSSRGHTGTLSNGTTSCNGGQCPIWNTSGIFGSAITFDGINDMINVTPTSALNVTGSITMEAWFNLRSSSSSQWILSKGNATNGYGIIYEGGPLCYINSTAANATGNATVNANRWYHFACAYDGSQIVIFIDGLRRANASYTNGIPRNPQPLVIGSRTLMDTFFNGSLDEVRISNVSRAFTVGFQYNITLPDVTAVRVYNSTNALVDEAASLGSITSYNKTLAGLTTSSEYRVVVEEAGGHSIEKWYPYRPGGACAATSHLDKIRFSTTNCPEVTDVYPASDVTFVGCL